jgi:tight adherence protein B
MDTPSYLMFVAGFLAVLLMTEGAYLAWNSRHGTEAKRIARRLRALSAADATPEVSIAKIRLLATTPRLNRWLHLVPRIRQLDRLLLQSGLSLSVASAGGFMLACAAGAALLATVEHLPSMAVIAAALVGAALPVAYVLHARSRRLTLVDEQLPDALELMARALQAGHAFPSALQMAGEEMPLPTGAEFRITFDEVNYGIPLQTALMNLAARVPSTDLHYFVVAVLIQRETGGNLAELLNTIGALIRSRQKFQRTVRVLSAEGRLSAQILSVLPFAFGGAVYLIRRDFLAVLWLTPEGRRMVAAALLAMLLGFAWIWRLTKIRV